MGKYKKLLGNTVLFGMATFSSKILAFVLSMVLTHYFTTENYSTMGLAVKTCNFIVPVISVCIHEGIIRFGLDRSERRSDVYTTALVTIFCGYALLILCWPLLNLITRINEFLPYIYLYVLTSALRSSTTHFVRASGFSRIFALDATLTTALTVGLTLLFVVKLELGVGGYLLGTIIGDACSAFGLTALLKLYRFFKPAHFSKQTCKEMLRYSVPLVPTAIFWWVTNLSDAYIVDYYSRDLNGLYEVSYKIPTIITLVSTIFIQAWQISAFSEEDGKERVRFYSTVFTAYQALVFIAASGLILLIKPITGIMFAEAFYESWRFSPLLMLAVSCSCLVTFLGTIYNVAKRNRMVTVTTFIGAATNLVMNLLLIPKHGPGGAAFATFLSYFIVFLIRLVDTRRYIALRISPARLAASFLFLFVQVWACMSEVKYWIPIEIAMLLLLVLTNFGPVLHILKSMLGRKEGHQIQEA